MLLSIIAGYSQQLCQLQMPGQCLFFTTANYTPAVALHCQQQKRHRAGTDVYHCLLSPNVSGSRTPRTKTGKRC
jgi:hypothetical protein